MAGSTITIIPKRSHTTTTGGGGITYRVAVDVARIQANVLACEGARLSELTVRNWLRSVGFTPEPGSDGQSWLVDAEALRRLNKSEILRIERVREYAPCVERDAV
jgi:hypothetical protein